MAREACGTVAAGPGGHEIGWQHPRDGTRSTRGGGGGNPRKFGVCTHPPTTGGRTDLQERRPSPRSPGGGERMGQAGLRLVPPGDGHADVDVLMRRVARADASAFEALYDELSSSVFGLARRVVRDPARAEDVTQEVFLEVWR